jgi:hypothetical protein
MVSYGDSVTTAVNSDFLKNRVNSTKDASKNIFKRSLKESETDFGLNELHKIINYKITVVFIIPIAITLL